MVVSRHDLIKNLIGFAFRYKYDALFKCFVNNTQTLGKNGREQELVQFEFRFIKYYPHEHEST